MSLFLLRLPIDLAALARAANDRGWTKGRAAVFDEGAALHHLLSETYGPGALQPFRLMVAPRAASGRLYAYSTSKPEELRVLAAATAMPEIGQALAPEKLEAKPMPSHWKRGQRLGIDIRLRPTVRLAREIPPPGDRRGARGHGFAAGAEVDAYLAEALKNPGRDAMTNSGRDRNTVYREWLAARLANVAVLEEARLSTFHRKITRRGDKAHEAPDIVMQGTITIIDPTAFAGMLARGVGRHRAYGFGMMLLRPPGKPASTG